MGRAGRGSGGKGAASIEVVEWFLLGILLPMLLLLFISCGLTSAIGKCASLLPCNVVYFLGLFHVC